MYLCIPHPTRRYSVGEFWFWDLFVETEGVMCEHLQASRPDQSSVVFSPSNDFNMLRGRAPVPWAHHHLVLQVPTSAVTILVILSHIF